MCAAAEFFGAVTCFLGFSAEVEGVLDAYGFGLVGLWVV